jgi:hypothetical protein
MMIRMIKSLKYFFNIKALSIMDFSHLFTDWTVILSIISFVAIPISIIYVTYLVITIRKEKKVELARKLSTARKIIVPQGTLPRDFGQKSLYNRPAAPKTTDQVRGPKIDSNRIVENDRRNR